MDPANILIYGLNGLYYAAILFMVALGLSLVFGVLDLLNLAHAGFLGLGAYFGASVSKYLLAETGSALLVYGTILVLTPLVVMIVGAIMEKTVFQPLYDVREEYQLLATFGMLLMFENTFKAIWGAQPVTVPAAVDLLGSVQLLDKTYPGYYLLVIGVFVVTAAFPFYLFRRTRLGKTARAVSEDKEMVQALGIDVDRIHLIVFGLSTGLAGLGGAMLAPVSGAVGGLSASYVILAFAVIVIGGLGSLKGAVIASLIIGLVRAFGLALFSGLELALIFLLMAVFILVQPEGLFGGEGVIE
ncbi:MAG: branched-chain amino acid ABC transporter permease [Halanaeroarchaeum sp.]